MASEKGDLPQDTDSLPPNYASSEAYSDSPPPAYRKTSTVRLQITRVVCFTVLAAGFLTGLFILAHTWINTRNACDCAVAPNLPMQSASIMEASDIPKIANLEAKPGVEITESNAMDADVNDGRSPTEEYTYDQESRQMDIPLPDEDESSEVIEDATDDTIEGEDDGLQSLVKDSENRVKLPVDLLLGNPALAGKDVQCKVEKKIQNLGGGILSKTIMVTCDDDGEDEAEVTPILSPFGALMGSRPAVAPPMSILAPILKMMAARANSRLQRQMQPRPSFRRLPQPFLQPIGISVSGPVPQAFQGPFSNSIESSGPMPIPVMGSIAVRGPMNEGPTSNDFSQGMPMPVPGHAGIGPMPFFNQEPMQQHHHHHHFEPEPRMPFPNAGNMRFEPQEEQNMPFRGPFEQETEEPERPFIPEPIFRPFPPQEIPQENEPEVENPTPVRIVQGFPPQIPDAIKQIVSHIMRSNKDKTDKVPVIAIKAIPRPTAEESDQGPPKSKLLLPFPFRAVKMQTREGRILGDEEERQEAPFPLPRGAIPSGIKPVVMPEAAGRALDSPVTLPSLQELPAMRFFPGRLLRLPVPLPNGRVITHMEMKQNSNSVVNNDENEEPTTEEHRPLVPQENEEEAFTPKGPDFGPPRRHTVIREPPPMEEDNIFQESGNALPPFLQRFPPPPPPRFAAEGRSGNVREINPEAELVRPAESREHHTVMVN